jgi:hypothetical protein
MIRILIKILTAGPLLRYLGEKTDGYKTIIGIVGLVCTIVAYIAAALHPGLIDPAVLPPPQELETVLEGALAAFGALMAGGLAHKGVKRRRGPRAGEVIEEDLAVADDPAQIEEQAEVHRRMDELRARLADWEGRR